MKLLDRLNAFKLTDEAHDARACDGLPANEARLLRRLIEMERRGYALVFNERFEPVGTIRLVDLAAEEEAVQ